MATQYSWKFLTGASRVRVTCQRRSLMYFSQSDFSCIQRCLERILQSGNSWRYASSSKSGSTTHRCQKIVYNHQIFFSAESFLDAFHNGTLERIPKRPKNSANHAWSSRKRIGPQRDLDHLPGPRSVSFAGLRFKVDRNIQYISWMGWGLYLGFDRDMGLSLWDIRLRNERIVYQVRQFFQICIAAPD